MNACDISFGNYNKAVFLKSQEWLSDPEIKRLTMAPDTSFEERLKWFESLQNNNRYHIESIIVGNEAVGVVGLKNINPKDKYAEYFGYLGNKEYIGVGIGKLMLDHVCEIARHMNLRKIYLKVADYNTRAYYLYVNQGFVINANIDNVIWMEKLL